MVLILSECTNSSYETIWTALSRTAPHIINLGPLLSTLCNGFSSPRGHEQHNLLYKQLWAEQLHTIYKLLSSRWLWQASQQIMLLVTGAAYIIQLIRDSVTLTLELAWYVVDGMFPVQGPGAWLPWQGLESVSIDQTLKYGGQIIEYLHRVLLKSTSAAFGGSARSGDFL